jgi:hypothetical protein
VNQPSSGSPNFLAHSHVGGRSTGATRIPRAFRGKRANSNRLPHAPQVHSTLDPSLASLPLLHTRAPRAQRGWRARRDTRSFTRRERSRRGTRLAVSRPARMLIPRVRRPTLESHERVRKTPGARTGLHSRTTFRRMSGVRRRHDPLRPLRLAVNAVQRCPPNKKTGPDPRDRSPFMRPEGIEPST